MDIFWCSKSIFLRCRACLLESVMQRGWKWRSGMQGVAVLVKGGTIRRRRAEREGARLSAVGQTMHQAYTYTTLKPSLLPTPNPTYLLPTPTPYSIYTFHLNLWIHSIHLTFRLCLHLIQNNCYLWGFQTDVILEFDPLEAKFSWYFNQHNPFRAESSLTAENVLVLMA